MPLQSLFSRSQWLLNVFLKDKWCVGVWCVSLSGFVCVRVRVCVCVCVCARARACVFVFVNVFESTRMI